MRKFAPVELTAFFRALDAELPSPATVQVIGGAALSFYAPEHSTNDIDYVGDAALFEDAYARLGRRKSIAMLPLQRVAVHHGPEGLDERWETASVEPPLQRLTVLIPERHDLVLLKLSRGFSHDLEGVYEIHRAQPLELKTLVQRYLDTWVTGSRTDFRISFLLALEKMFGKDVADGVESQLGEQ